MNHPRPTPPPAATGGHRAAQQDTTVTGVDWPVCHAWTEGDPDFTGDVTVFDAGNTQRASTSWRTRPTRAPMSPFAESAGTAPRPWEPDWTGRRTAPVTPVPVHPGVPDRRLPQQRLPAGTGEP